MGIEHYHNIWNDFKSGNHSAFTLVYNQNVDKLYSYGTKICSDQNLVKDCIQDVFIKLFEKRDKIKSLESIRYYLFKALKHALIDSMVLEKKKHGAIQNFDFSIEYSAEAHWIDKEIGEAKSLKIKNMLNQLTPKQKEVIYLRYNENLCFAEIAEILGLSIDSVKKQTYRSLGKLRKNLEAD